MRERFTALFVGLALLTTPFFFSAQSANAAQPEKEWTFLLFLNGNNNLDSFGTMNLNQMEQVGSNDQLNIVVQWASLRNKKVQRLYVQKDNDPKKVTSPVIQDMGRVDMGDYRNLVEFIRWGHENYPAKKYFVAVWDHGSGWHAFNSMRSQAGDIFHPTDISWDDNSGNFMTTKQLGQAIAEGSRIIGHKIDLYGSDACLMAMAEVAGEMKNSVSYFVGSQEVEPGAGWPYDQVFKRWVAQPQASARDISVIWTEEYIKSYQGGTNGNQQVTFSAFDLSKTDQLHAAISGLGQEIQRLDAGSRKKLVTAARQAQSFTYSDYRDVLDFLRLVEGANVEMSRSKLNEVRQAVQDYVVINKVTSGYAKATGLSFWLPNSMSQYNQYSNKYADLTFQTETQWSQALRYMLQDGSSSNGSDDSED